MHTHAIGTSVVNLIKIRPITAGHVKAKEDGGLEESGLMTEGLGQTEYLHFMQESIKRRQRWRIDYL